jgi:hypothetical protein
MNADVLTHGTAHRLGENATRPIELRNGTLAALPLLARDPSRVVRALPAHCFAAHSGAPNCFF